MDQQVLAWSAIGLYVLITIYLTIRGALKTKDLNNYALGNKDIPPVLVGISLTAQLTSVATFVVNPGLIYKYGLSGMLGFGIAAALGITTGLFVFSKKFLTVGSKIAAITVPQWIGKRYESRTLQVLFAIISLALITFGVLIVVALSLSLGKLVGINAYIQSGTNFVYNAQFSYLIMAVIAFVFTYMMIGGANTHAYTNSIQGFVMLIVAFILIFSGAPLLFKDGGIVAKLASIDKNLVTVTNPASLYFRNIFEVFVCNFLVGLAIVCQPHIVSKVLYLKDEKQIKPYLTTAVLAGFVFALVMITGFYARVTLPNIERMDFVIPYYITANFSPIMQIIITIGIVCAGLSTLEGILLSLSTIFSTDIFMPIFKKNKNLSETQLIKRSLNSGKLLLVVTAVIIAVLSIMQVKNPTGGSVAIFGMYGVYLLFTTSFFPLACGMFLPDVSKKTILIAVIASIVIYFTVAFYKITYMHNNPAFLATCAIIGGWIIIFASKKVPAKQKA